MVASRRDENPSAKRPPARTPQGRENRLVDLAFEVAEDQLLSGNASSQVITSILKWGTEQTRLERLKLEQEAKLREAQVDRLESEARVEELYRDAMDAFRGYQPSRETEIE